MTREATGHYLLRWLGGALLLGLLAAGLALMGYPLGWTDCEDSATPSSPKSQSGLEGE